MVILHELNYFVEVFVLGQSGDTRSLISWYVDVPHMLNSIALCFAATSISSARKYSCSLFV